MLGIVNSEKAEKAEKAERIRLCHATDPDRDVYILAPSEFAPNGDVVSGRLTEFRSKSGELRPVQIAYWLVDKIFTEDVIDLIGAEAIRDKLGVRGAGGAGRLDIRHSDKRATSTTGYGSIASRLMWLLGSQKQSGPWALLERNHASAQNTIDDDEFAQAARESTQTAFRVVELDNNPAASMDHLASGKSSGLPDENEIRWLTDLLPETAKAVPKVVAAMKKAAGDAGLVKAALAFLRGLFPDDAAGEPVGLDDARAAEWWIARWAERRSGPPW